MPILPHIAKSSLQSFSFTIHLLTGSSSSIRIYRGRVAQNYTILCSKNMFYNILGHNFY